MQSETYLFGDDGKIPNSPLPVIIYRNAFDKRGREAADWLETRFKRNHWSGSWRNGIYSYHHYHSNTHEVLGVYSGKAKVQLGGENGMIMVVSTGDVVVIPAGVGHKNLGSSPDFGVVGAYPGGRSPDLKKGFAGERPQSDKNIAKVPLPKSDPVMGKDRGCAIIWKEHK